MMIGTKKTVKEAFASLNTPADDTCFHEATILGIHAFDRVLMGYGFCLDQAEFDFPGDHGQKTIFVNDDSGKVVGNASFEWTLLPSDDYKVIGSLSHLYRESKAAQRIAAQRRAAQRHSG